MATEWSGCSWDQLRCCHLGWVLSSCTWMQQPAPTLVPPQSLPAGQPGARGAIICAAIGGVAHLAAARVEAAGGLQQLLISMDLLDPPPPPPPGSPEAAAAQAAAQAAAATAAAAAAAQQQAEQARPWWHQYMPLRRMSDQEFEEYKAKQDDAQRKR